jgi:protein-disulfide isomerase/uncharacterized membrane protein
MPSGSTRHRVALVIALVGVAACAYTWYVTSQIAGGTGFEIPGCKGGGPIDCELVLTSRWGKFLGWSVAGIGAVVFAVGALLALPGAVKNGRGGMADLLLLGLVGGSVGFALVLLIIAVGVIGRICLFCLTIDTIVVAWFVAVAPLAQRFAPAARDLVARRSTAHATLAAGVLVAVAAGTWGAVAPPAGGGTREEVCRSDPKFCQAWKDLPVLERSEVLGDARHTKGATKAAVTIVEFSDFQCPACGVAFADLRNLVRDHRDVRIVFRHFPLDARCNPEMPKTLHPEACTAAVAAECAGQQGRFWEYHDLLFENQTSLDRDSFFRFARDLGLDIPRFRSCLDDAATMAVVAADAAAGTQAGVQSTPTLFINGRRVQGALEHHYWDLALVLERDVAGGGS